jgi:hypothetical protein
MIGGAFLQQGVRAMKTGLIRMIAVAATCVAASAPAANYGLSDGNSVATISDVNGATVWRIAQGGAAPGSSPDNVFISNFLFRIGSSSGERNIASGIGAPVLVSQSANTVSYAASNDILSARLDWSLTGFASDSGMSTLTKSVVFTNVSGGALDFHLFDYSDYDIRFNPAAQRDSARLASPGRVIINSASVPFSIDAQTSVAPDRYQIDGFFPLYQALFLDSDGATTLNNTPATGVRFPATPGDSAFAFQWSRTLAAGESFAVTQIARFVPTSAVPEPHSWALLISGFAMAGAGIRGRRRADRALIA